MQLQNFKNDMKIKHKHRNYWTIGNKWIQCENARTESSVFIYLLFIAY